MRKILLVTLAICTMVGCKNETKENDMQQFDFLQLAADRYSVRHFSDKPVSDAAIDTILEAAKLAPTAVNSQPQMIYVLKSEEAIKAANEISPCIYGAPHAFLVCYDSERVCPRGDNDNYGQIDCSIVITHMLLAAQSIGIGTCPVGYFNPEEAIKAFNLPENIHPVLLIPFGYPADDAAPSERHTQYRDKAEMVEVR